MVRCGRYLVLITSVPPNHGIYSSSSLVSVDGVLYLHTPTCLHSKWASPRKPSAPATARTCPAPATPSKSTTRGVCSTRRGRIATTWVLSARLAFALVPEDRADGEQVRQLVPARTAAEDADWGWGCDSRYATGLGLYKWECVCADDTGWDEGVPQMTLGEKAILSMTG